MLRKLMLNKYLLLNAFIQGYDQLCSVEISLVTVRVSIGVSTSREAGERASIED
jgi:hypothetical protein